MIGLLKIGFCGRVVGASWGSLESRQARPVSSMTVENTPNPLLRLEADSLR